MRTCSSSQDFELSMADVGWRGHFECFLGCSCYQEEEIDSRLLVSSKVSWDFCRALESCGEQYCDFMLM
jgi:hypothetical protein